MKLFLDDERKAPDGWIQVRCPEEAIKYLRIGKVTVISLDHDLGDDKMGTGYDVILWIEKEMFLKGFNPPEIKIHSANSSARIKMELGVRKINQMKCKNTLIESNIK